MKRFQTLLLLALPLSGSCVPAFEKAEDRPNILWITVEDISPRLGCYGDTVARTPALDRLAEQGIRYDMAFTTAGVCAPSRSSIITGMYQSSIGTHHMRTTHKAAGLPTPYFAVLPPQVKAFPEYLRSAGYYCTNNVKTDYQFGNPFTVWDESSKSAHWKNRAEAQPFFAVFNFTTTHESQVWPKPDKPLETDPGKVELPPYYPDTQTVREDMSRHYDNISAVDKQVAEILRQLQEDGLNDNTVVFFFSDHGDGLPRAKRWLYDSGLRVPLIVRWPGKIQPGSVSRELISFVDLAPTILSIAGIEPLSHMQGRAFLGSYTQAPRQYIYGARDRIDESYDFVRAVRDKRFKFIRNFFPGKPYILPVPYRDRGQTMQEILRLDKAGQLTGPQLLWTRKTRPPEELYDVEADPHEVNNLIDDQRFEADAARLRAELERWMKQIDDKGHVAEAEMVESMWPGKVQPMTEKPVVNPFGGSFDSPISITLSPVTPGSSIGYTLEEGEQAHWFLYSKPIRLEQSSRLRAKAVRYGYKESPEVLVNFTISN